MARMKFLCDTERCIECNGCVTACNNINEVPWGMNRRHVVTLNDGEQGEKSISVACMHCTDAPCAAVCPVDCFYTTADGIVLHDKDLCIGCGYCFYACPFGAPQYPQGRRSGCGARWTSAPSAPGGPCRTTPPRSTRPTGATASPRASSPVRGDVRHQGAPGRGRHLVSDIYRKRIIERAAVQTWRWETAYP